ncbi:MAG: DUF3775 domain-containing protein [Gammaproteobacteria bacterium]|nr:DUF3775 domain-containing protein [Gammaproteobacteria bacterium]
MLEQINPETVCRIIGGIREFQAKEEVVLPEVTDSSSDDWALQVLADHGDDLTYDETRGVIDDLEPDQQIALVALMWVGRGDFLETEWDDALAAAEEHWNPRTAEYLLATPLADDYIEEGLALLGYSCAE